MSWESLVRSRVRATWACRVIPLFLLKGWPPPAQALGFIPPAAFAFVADL
ncbi:MAG: hypothetical protein ACLUE1_05580 [Adlercreutzia equolifaciens]